MNTLVSIIMPVYNSEKFLDTAIQSVLDQTYSEWELIVINDASTDKSKEKLEKYTDQRIKVIENKENLGIAKSRNKGITLANGDYISFLDSDDWWLPEKLVQQLQLMKNKSIDFSCSAYYVSDEIGTIINERNVKAGFKNYQQLLKTNSIGCLTVMAKAELLKANPMPMLKHEDYATWLNILKTGVDVYFIEEKLAVYRKTASSTSANKWNTIIWVWKILRENEHFSVVKSSIYLARFLFFTTFKYATNE